MAFQQACKRHKEKRGKVTAPELCRALRNHFIMFHGDKALEMMRGLKIKTSDDVGEMVTNLVQVDLLRLSEGDSRADFTGTFDFESEIQKWRRARRGGAWGLGVMLLALPMLFCAGRELWRALRH